MKTNHWIIALDQSPMDGIVLSYTRFLAHLLQPDHLDIVHIVNENNYPSYLPQDYFDFRDQVVYEQKLQIEAKVESILKDPSIPYSIHVLDGSPFEEIMNMAIGKNASLVIAGRKNKSSGSGVISERLSGGLPCNFLLIPEGCKPELNRILVCTDFSEHSSLAMNEAMKFRQKNHDINLLAQHIYKLPQGYSKSGKGREEYMAIMKTIAGKKMKDWLLQYPFQAESFLTFHDEGGVEDLIMGLAIGEEADFLVIGSKGQTSASLALLGSHTLKLINKNNRLPMLIVKKEGENFKLIDAIRSI